MRLFWLAIAFGFCLQFTGCGKTSHDLNHAEFELIPLFKTSSNQLDISSTDNQVLISFTDIAAEGCFARLELPDNLALSSDTWYDADSTIHLVVTTQDGLDIGLAPIDGFDSQPVSVSLVFTRRASDAAPSEVLPLESVPYLRASQVGANVVSLEWPEVNRGDYDFNGEINISDITPIASKLGGFYNTQSPDINRTIYWIDGDRNGEINIADLTPIGANLHRVVAGYQVRRFVSESSDGILIRHLDRSETSIRRDESISRAAPPEPLPNKYVFLTDGETNDGWTVTPVDGTQTLGDPSDFSATIEKNEFDADISIVISGIDLVKFLGGSSGAVDSGYSLMRVILPIDDIDNHGISEDDPMRVILPIDDIDGLIVSDVTEGTGGTFKLDDVPRDVTLLLEIKYAPRINLLTGEAFFELSDDDDTIAAGEALARENAVTTRLPFLIPQDAENMSITPSIIIAQVPGESSHTVRLDATINWTGNGISYSSILDLASGLVQVDADKDGSFADEALLTDASLDSISDARLHHILDSNEYGYSAGYRFRGTLASINAEGGSLVIADPEQYVGGPSPFAPPVEDFMSIGFTELTRFTTVPAELVPGALIIVDMKAYSHAPELEIQARWASAVED